MEWSIPNCTEQQMSLTDFMADLDSAPIRCHHELVGRSRLDRQWSFIDRAVSEHLLYAPIDGRIEVSVGRQRELIEPGGLLWLPPNQRYSARLAGRARVSLYHFRFRLFRGNREMVLPKAIVENGLTGMREWCVQWYASWHGRLAHGDARARSLLLLLVADLAELARHRPGTFTAAQRRRLGALVDRSRGMALDSRDLADELLLSRVHFTRLFKASYGVPPRTWLMQRRLEQARALLATTSLSVAAIAERLGYSGPQLLCRQFRAQYGETPLSCRRRLA